MTKSKVFMSTIGVLAAAGAVVAGILVKKRGQIKVQGEVETKGNGMPGRSKGVRGQASVSATSPNRPSQT